MISAVLLAAGSARRFDGGQKLLASVPYEGATIPLVRLSVMCLLAAPLERVIVVVGREGDAVRRGLAGCPVEIVSNADAEGGMSSSLRLGVEAAARIWPDSRGLLVALGDQPIVDREIIHALVRQLDLDGVAIVAPRFQGTPGTPVLFTPPLLPELLALRGDRGARSVVERDASRVRYVDFAWPAPRDVDTVTDLTNLVNELRTSSAFLSSNRCIPDGKRVY